MPISPEQRRHRRVVSRRCLTALLATLSALIAIGSAGCGASRAEIAERERDAEYHYNLGYGYFFSDNSPNADAALQSTLHALSIKPDYPEAHMLLGLIYMGRESFLDAVTHFRRAIELKPDYRDARHNLGATYLAAERWDEAAAIFTALVEDRFYGTPGHGHNNLGWALYKKGDLAAARTHFERAIKLAPELCLAYNNLGLVLLDGGDADDAARELDRAVRRCPGYAEPHYHLGRVEAQRRNVDEARTQFGRCRDLAGDAPLAERCERLLAALPPSGAR